MSAIIDRQAAANKINAASKEMAQAGSKLIGIRENIVDLSNVVKAHSGSTMYTSMKDFWDDLGVINQELYDKFYDINTNLMALVNNSGGTSTDQYNLETADYEKESTVPTSTPGVHDILTGIGDYSDIANILQSYSNRLGELDQVFTNVVQAYKDLYDLAQEGPYHDMLDNAHAAANSVRAVAERINSYAREFSSQFNSHIEYWSEKNGQIDAASKASIDTCKTIASNCVISLPNAYY